MQDTRKPTRPPREKVLILSYPDGYVEAYAEPHIDIHFARVPMAFSVEGEQQAEQIVNWILPKRYRDLYRADRLRTTGTTRPLLPRTLRQSLGTNDLLKLLNETDKAAPMLPCKRSTVRVGRVRRCTTNRNLY